MTRHLPVLLGVVLLGACQNEPTFGTVVGNPTKGALRMAQGADVDLRAGDAAVAQMRWTDCEGGGRDVAIDAPLGLFGGGGFDAPQGTWCEVQVVFDGALTLSGSAGRRPVAVVLEPDTAVVSADDGFTLTEAPFVLELAYPGWLSTDDLEVADPPDGGLVLEPTSPAHDTLTTVVAVTSGLYADGDGDGEVSERERAEGSVAGGSRRPTDRRR